MTMAAGKRRAEESVEAASGSGAGEAAGEAAAKRQRCNATPRTCVHEVAVPDDFVEEAAATAEAGSIQEPVYNGVMAKSYPFTLDPFQRISVACLERKESVLVSAHTSAGKTAIAEYAVAMAFRDKQKVIYTSPLKALSNQKYRELSQEFSDVGLMTGDVSISPNATCIVMTTEILRAMLYRGSELLREVAWVVFDEIHYMRDRERGVVWEESIILLPPAIKMVFLSATMSNAIEFAEWICHVHKQPCHVVYTDFRPTPLQHYAFGVGGSGMFLVVDEKGQFKEDNFAKLQTSRGGLDDTSGGGGRGRGGGGGGRGGGGKWSKGRGGGGGAGGASDIYKIVKMIMDRKMQPVIVFSFSRRECEQYALSISKLDFNSDEEKQDVEHIFNNAIQALGEEDKDLPAIGQLLPLLKRGIAFHHSGLLPLLKEIIEILFQEGFVKALFATETFAMGLNMPAKTVVFTALRKWDGDAHRWMSSGEYIQMSGRAGRRGKDDRGICIIMVDEQMEMKTCKEMILGKPAPLISTFRLSYYSLLNLMSRAEGQIDMEHLIRNSFHQFQHEKAAPEVEEKINRLEREAASLDGKSEELVSEYHGLRLKLAGLEKKLMAEVARPERILIFLQPGRLVKVRDGANEWGWGVVLNVVKKPGTGVTPSASTAAPRSSSYLVDTLLCCSPANSREGGQQHNKPRPCPPGQKAELQVIPVQMTLICAISNLRVAVPADLRPADARMSVLMAIQDLEKRYPEGIPRLDPVEDMGIDDPEMANVVKQIEEEEKKLAAHPLFKSENEPSNYAAFQKKAELLTEAQRLKVKMRDSQLHKFREELRNRTRVLKRLGHISDDSVVQLKGRAACLIDTADELLVAELILEGLFNDLDHHQIVALSSCFLPMEKSNVQVDLKNELAWPFRRLQETARMIAEVERECKLEVNVEEIVEGYRPTLMNVFYQWSKGSSFADICAMTDVFEGTIIRVARRLDEFLNQMRATSQAVGNKDLEKKFEAASESIRRGIMFANSLYL